MFHNVSMMVDERRFPARNEVDISRVDGNEFHRLPDWAGYSVRAWSAFGSILVAPAGASIGPPGVSSSRIATRPVAPSTNCRMLISAAVSLPLSSHRSSTIGRSFGASWKVSPHALLSPATAVTRRLNSEYALVVEVVTIR